MKRIIKGAEPYLLQGGRTGCLLVHGHTATPAELRKLGEHLHKAGFTVLGIRLMGHATDQNDMRRVRWRDWMADVESGWYLLRNITDQIFVVGLSLGGALSLTFSSHFPVNGVVSMAAPYKLKPKGLDGIMLPLIPILKGIIPFRAKGAGNWFNPEAVQTRLAYKDNPLNSALEVTRLLAEMRGRLKEIKAPVLLIHSKDDDYVVPENLELIRQQLTYNDVSVKYIEKATHVITEDGDTEALFEMVRVFIQSKAGQI